MLKDRVASVLGNIARVCAAIGRDPRDITLVGVTKFATAEKIIEAVEAGICHIGENKVQEGQKKFPIVDQTGKKVTKHLIGHLQTNKVKVAVKFFDLIQSVDSLKLAQEIDSQAQKLGRPYEILVQINTAHEEQKYGADPAEALSLVDTIARLPNLKIRGLMTIAPFIDDQTIVRQCFRDLKNIYDRVARDYAGHERVAMKILSMGMTQDYPLALEEGSNMLRIGTAIFGE